jgi:hypothetical protein
MDVCSGFDWFEQQLEMDGRLVGVRTFVDNRNPEAIDMIASIKNLLGETTDFRRAA